LAENSERGKREIGQIRLLESQLSDIGAVIMHKMRMHEQLVFIDDCVKWSGSLNPLSFSNTQEIMERRNSKSVMVQYFKTLMLDELLSVPGTEESRCPICGDEMLAAEGAKEPYYWRCVNDDCYTRSVDQQHPYDGLLTCQNCGEPVKFGNWGDRPCWRCTGNNRHRQRMYKSHLRLPKMVALIPESEHRNICQIFGTSSFDTIDDRPGSRNEGLDPQGTLFRS